MEIGDILSQAIRYPLNDTENIKNPLIIFGILAGPLLLFMIALFTRNNTFITITAVLEIIGVIVYVLLAPGYLLSVMKEGINRSGIIPELQLGKNIVDTLKLWAIGIVYSIVPMIILALIFFLVIGVTPPKNPNAALGAIGIFAIIAIVIIVLLEMFISIATLRLAKTDSISEAVNISQVWAELQEIGILKMLLFCILISIIGGFIYFVGMLLNFIPIIGPVITILIIYMFAALFESYAFGLLYSDIA